MLEQPSRVPVGYVIGVEDPQADDGATADALVTTLHGIQETTHRHSGRALRAVHAKSHGLLHGVLQVLPGLAPELAQGLFARPASYSVLMRLSSTPGDLLDDAVSTPRGLALKVMGVEGERLPGSEQATTQNYALVDSPAFPQPDARHFVRGLKLLAATTDRAEGAKKVLSAALRGVEKLIEAAGGRSATLLALGGHPATHPLGETYFSQVPLRHGAYIAKIALRPLSPALLALKDQPIALKDRPDALRDEVVDFFATQGAEWELCVQLCTDLVAMPVEDASVVWPEDLSPWQPVARVRVMPQRAWSDARAAAIDDAMAFSPWQGLAAHQPLGSVMRARRVAYEEARRFRERHNGQAVAEPAVGFELPD